MKTDTTPLRAQPLASSADLGPVCRTGPALGVVAISLVLLFLALGLAFFKDGYAELALGFIIADLAISAGILFSLLRKLRAYRELPRAPSVLADHLGFRLDFTCQDLAMAAFFDPDEVRPGATLQLLLFVENYASRQRIAEFQVGPHAQLGLPIPRTLSLHLAPGQSAVYVFPLQLSRDVKPGDHDLPIALHIRKPAGTGLLLPGPRRHLHNLHHAHFAVPFRASDLGPLPVQETPLLGPVYLTLATLESPEPDFRALEARLP